MLKAAVFRALDNAKANGFVFPESEGWVPEGIAIDLQTYDAELEAVDYVGAFDEIVSYVAEYRER